jgi:outer membrane immunogenic protein
MNKQDMLGFAASVAAALAVAASVSTGANAQEARAPIWTGAYIGAHIGGSFGKYNGLGESVSISGATGGLHAGFNWQNGAMVFGIEGDADISGADKSETSTSGRIEAKLSNPFLGSIRGRVGVASGPALFYATGGLAFSSHEISASGYGATVSIKDESRTGYVLGIGMDYAISSKISARIEALQYNFKDVFVDVAGSGLKYDATTVRSGMSYRF